MSVDINSIIFCDSVVPGFDGKLNVYGLFSKLKAKSFPLTVPKFSLVISWSGGTGFHVQVVKMLNENRTAVLHQSPEMYFTLESEDDTAFVQLDFNNMVFPSPGHYPLDILLDGRSVGMVSVLCEEAES